MIHLETTRGVRYVLDDVGAVQSRSDGPEGWNYSGKWIITGFRTRWNSRMMVPLASALDGADIGHGYVCDLDHGTPRTWFGSPGRAKRVYRED